MKYGDKVVIHATNETGYVWAASGEIVYVCVPDLTSKRVRVYLVNELSTCDS